MKDLYVESMILVNNRPITEYRGENASVWIEARENSAYSIKLKSTDWGRKLVVISVDGINVITGEPAVEEPKDGYILPSRSPLTIEGWRTGNKSVKEFIFTFNKDKSYSARLGKGKENLGVIGILIYSEVLPYLSNTFTAPIFRGDIMGGYKGTGDNIEYPYKVTCQSMGGLSYSCNDAPMSIPSVKFQAGTAKGKEIESHVTEVSFIAGNLESKYIYYYDSMDNLKKRGIVVEKKQGLPQPFATKYCPDID